MLNSDIDFAFSYTVGGERFDVDTRELKKELDGMPINDIAVINFIDEMIRDNILKLNGGKNI
jgi:hypothetical protein